MKRRLDFLLLAVVIAGVAVLVIKCVIVYHIKWIGDTDEAAYAEMADNFIHGKGLSNDYIQYCYFISRMKYPEITHPDAHYAPLYSLLTVPFFLILGKSAFAAKLPAMMISSIFLPVLLYLLVKQLSGSRIAGLAAALGILAFPEIFSWSLIPDDDSIFPFMVIASCFFIIKAQDSSRYYYLAGAFMGLTYYAKGVGLWLTPVYLVFCVIRNGFRNRRVWYCFAIAFLVMLPWFVRNTVHFRNPIFSTQQYAAGYIGYKGWEEGTYSLYWDKDMPSLLSKFKEAGLEEVWGKSVDFLKQYLWWSFVDIDESWGEFDTKNLHTYSTGILAVMGLFLFLLSHIYSLFSRLFASPGRRINNFFTAWRNRDFHILWLVEFSLMLFISITWQPIQRLAFSFIAINMAVGWTTLYIGTKQIFGWARYSNVFASCLVVLLMLPVLSKSASIVYEEYKDADFPYGEAGETWMEAGKWIKENLPGSITMFREPGQLHYYSEEKGIQIPLAELDKIIKVMKYYKVTHIIPRVSIRPALRPLVEGEIPGFKLVYDEGLEIYEIQYDLLPL